MADTRIWPALAMSALMFAGCATAPEPMAAAAPVASPPRVLGGSVDKIVPRKDDLPQRILGTPPQLRKSDALEPAPTPDAIVKFDAKTGQLSDEMRGRLLKVAAAAKSDGGIIVRIEGYVPSGGSPAMDLGRADGPLQVVKDHLQRLGVSPRRILLASFGAEHEVERDATRPWVEIYLVETGSASSNAETTAGK